MDKRDPNLLRALDKLHVTIAQCDSENVYSMDKTGLFFQLLPRYTSLMPSQKTSVNCTLCKHHRNAQNSIHQKSKMATQVHRSRIKHGWTLPRTGNGMRKSFILK